MTPLIHQIDHGGVITQFALSKVNDDLYRIIIGKWDKPETEDKRIVFNNTEIYLTKMQLDTMIASFKEIRIDD